MDPVFAFGNDSLDFLYTNRPSVIFLKRASWLKTAVKDSKNQGISNWFVRVVKWAVYENTSRVFGARHSYFFLERELVVLDTALLDLALVTVPDFFAD